MNKMIVCLENGALFKSIAAIEAYCHFLRLFIRLIAEFPAIQQIIDDKVEVAMKHSVNRNKTNLGDMGEFLILIAFSKFSFKNREIWKKLMVEYISRQFYWVIDKIVKHEVFVDTYKEINGFGTFFSGMYQDEIKEFYKASKISNNLLLFNVCASERFLKDREGFVKKIDGNFGVIEENEVQGFLEDVAKMKANVNDYEDLLKVVGLGEVIKNFSTIQELFKEAWKNSVAQKYNKNYF